MTIHVMKGDEVEFEEVRWLWRPYIPYGMLSTLVGDPGSGKTWLACKIAADLSRGVALPGHSTAYPPQKVLFASADDSVVHTLGPRMRDIGADLSKIFFVENKVTFNASGLREFEAVVRDYAVTFVVIDPVVGFFEAGSDSNGAVDVRQVMGGLKQIAERTGTSIVAVEHKRKASASNKGPKVYDAAGSMQFVGTSRSEMHVDQRGPRGTAVMSHIKSNIGPLGKALAYQFGSEEGPERSVHHFNWLDHIPQGAQTPANKHDEAVEFIRDLLAAGPVPAKVVYARGEENGFSERILKDAKRNVADSVKIGDGGWEWRLL